MDSFLNASQHAHEPVNSEMMRLVLTSGIRAACRVAFVLRIEQIGRFAATSVHVSLALVGGRVKCPRPVKFTEKLKRQSDIQNEAE